MKHSLGFFSWLLAGALLLSGCGGSGQPAVETVPATASETASESVPEVAEESRNLTISLTEDPDALSVFRPFDIGGNFLNDMQYRDVKDVTITLGDATLPLETALAEGKITEEEILCFAQLDARAGLCETEAVSLRGVSNFYFHYPEYSMHIIHDVLEAPDGQQHLVSEMQLYPHGQTMEPTTHFFDPETRAYLDWEDWGLTFELQQASPSGATIVCTQAGGQQIGTLVIRGFSLIEVDVGSVPMLEESKYDPQEPIVLNTDGTTTFTIDWTHWFGELPSGAYYLQLDIYDEFEEEDVPPLSMDFHQRQPHDVVIHLP